MCEVNPPNPGNILPEEETNFSSFKKSQESIQPRIWVKNLPKGIKESGIKNLFLTVGRPLSIKIIVRCDSAIVEFETMREVDLAIRDLDKKPPYNLGVSLYAPRIRKKEETLDNSWVSDWSEKVTPEEKCETENDVKSSENPEELKNQVQNFIQTLGYDPSIRMRQRQLDFQTECECISLGRGYLNTGKKDRFVGGLQKFRISSENSQTCNTVGD